MAWQQAFQSTDAALSNQADFILIVISADTIIYCLWSFLALILMLLYLAIHLLLSTSFLST
jgi:hypothetical protein